MVNVYEGREVMRSARIGSCPSRPEKRRLLTTEMRGGDAEAGSLLEADKLRIASNCFHGSCYCYNGTALAAIGLRRGLIRDAYKTLLLLLLLSLVFGRRLAIMGRCVLLESL